MTGRPYRLPSQWLSEEIVRLRKDNPIILGEYALSLLGLLSGGRRGLDRYEFERLLVEAFRGELLDAGLPGEFDEWMLGRPASSMKGG